MPPIQEKFKWQEFKHKYFIGKINMKDIFRVCLYNM